MNDIISFAQQHLFMVVTWLVLLIAIIVNEWLNKSKKAPALSPQHLVDLMNNQNVKVLDIRNHQNFRQGHILNSHNIVWQNQDINPFKPLQNDSLVIVCQQGNSASQLAEKLQKEGFSKVQILAGGLSAWQQNNLSLVKGK